MPGWRWLGLCCALMVGLLSLAGASELLHDHVHDGADTPEHACAIELYAHGVDNPDGTALLKIARDDVVVEPLRLAAAAAPAAVDLPLRPGRDPPAA